MDELLNELYGRLENYQEHRFDDNDLEMVKILNNAIALLLDNPKAAEQIWETFINLLDCASRDDANHFFGFKIERF